MTTKRNSELFHRIADQVELDPESYDQTIWVGEGGGWNDSTCGTVACVAGWAVTLGTQLGKLTNASWKITATGVLGITDSEANLLFCENWMPDGADDGDDDILRAKRVAEALRRIAEGELVSDVTDVDYEWPMAVARSDIDPSGV